MKQNITAVALAALLAAFGLSSSFAQEPSKVTGGGSFWDVGADGTTGSYQYLSFTVNVNPDKKGDRKSPQAVIQVDGTVVRDYWGGPLVLKGDFAEAKSFGDLFEENDPKPPQGFLFVVEHPDPDIGLVNVWVFTHDNIIPGYSTANPDWPDWFGVWIEPVGGNGFPDHGAPPWIADDDLFTVLGTVVSGNIVDHRK